MSSSARESAPGPTIACASTAAPFLALIPNSPCASLLNRVARTRLKFSQDGDQLLAQRLGVERLHDVVRDPGFLRRDHVLGLALGGDHDERKLLELGVGAHFLEELEAG